jgi:PKD domain
LNNELPKKPGFICADRYKEGLVVHPSRYGQIIAVAILGLMSTCVSAQAQMFSAPTNVSKNLDFSMTPQAAADASGNIYVVWEDDTANNSNILFGRSTDGGMTFLTQPLSNTTGYSSGPRICVDSKGAINVVWVDDTPGNPVVYFRRSTDGGATFLPPTSLSSVAAYSASPQIAVDGSGNISVVWESDSAPVGILFRNSADGVTFSATLNLATNPVNPNLTASLAPQMAIGVDGSINIVWEDDFNFQSDISFSRSTDQGATFSATTNLSHNAGNSFEAQIAVDLSGNINVAWVDDTPHNNDIFFTRSTDKGATFPNVINLSNSPGDSGSPQIGVDSSGNIFVAWQDNVPPVLNKDIYFALSSDGGVTFSNPLQNLSKNSGNSINPSMTVDAAGGVNLVWLDNTPGKANVFFARSVDSGATFTSPPQNVSNDSGASSDVQVVADSKGNLDLVWADNAFGANQIFFSQFTNPQVTKNRPPVANAGADQIVECTGRGCASVTLNGSGSSDPDGDTLSYVWTDQANNVVGTTAMVQLTVTLGAHSFNLTVTDPGGLSSTASTHVTVQDTVPPTLSVSLSPNYLWPPNHKLVQITATIAASDVCDANPKVQLVSITSSERDDSNDIQAVEGGPVAFGTDVRSFLLRAERNDSSNPRVYSVTYRVTDASGNATQASTQVQVSDPSWSNAGRTRAYKKRKEHKEHDRR